MTRPAQAPPAQAQPSDWPAQFWLMKSEPTECSIDHLVAAPGQTVAWVGVRNYQARNFMRDAMQPGDGVLFYHSSCAQPGVAGLATVAGTAYPDATQFDPASPYFDPKASRDAPRWLHVDVRLAEKPACCRCARCASGLNWPRCGCSSPAAACRSRPSHRPNGRP